MASNLLTMASNHKALTPGKHHWTPFGSLFIFHQSVEELKKASTPLIPRPKLNLRFRGSAHSDSEQHPKPSNNANLTKPSTGWFHSADAPMLVPLADLRPVLRLDHGDQGPDGRPAWGARGARAARRGSRRLGSGIVGAVSIWRSEVCNQLKPGSPRSCTWSIW